MRQNFINQKRILLLLWHPKTKALSSGGFIRIKEFIKEIPDDFIIDVLDNYPSIFEDEKFRGTIYQYKISSLIEAIEKKIFLIGRLLEGLVVFFNLVVKGRKLNKTFHYDVIYSPTAETFTTFAAIVLRGFCNAKVVLDSLNIDIPGGSWKNYFMQLRSCGYSFWHAFSLPTYMYLVRLLLIRCFNKADCIVTVSPYMVRRLRFLGIGVPTVDFTPSGINFERFADILPQNKIYEAIFVGRHEIAKGVFDLVCVWQDVVRDSPDAKLAMVGYCDPSTKAALLNKIKQKKLENNISLIGEINEEEKIKFLNQSRVYVHLSAMEPLFPVISILEGLACGLSVVSYDAPAYNETEEIHNNKAISLVPVGEYKKAALEILRYLRLEQSDVKEIGSIAKCYAKRFDWKQIADKQFNIIREAADTET